MAAWLKLLGTSENQIPDAWLLERPDLAKRVRFGRDRRPVDVRRGDELIYYGVGWKRIFAIAEVTSDRSYETAVRKEWERQWPWVLDVRVTAKVRHLSDAPSVLVLGSLPDLRHQGLVSLTAEQRTKAHSALP